MAGEEELITCRVATWNLWWRLGDWQARFEAIAAVLAEAAPDVQGITWSRANPHAAVTGEPDARIDHVLVGTPRGAGAALVTGARVVGDRPVGGVWPSDHAAVVADLRLGEPGYVGPGAAG